MRINSRNITLKTSAPFGSPLIGRTYQAESLAGYRYSFNGKENDNQIKGDGNSIAYEARIYDSRLGRFLSTDSKQKEYVWQSTYAYFKNAPITIIDIKGMGDKETKTGGGDEGKISSPSTTPKPGPDNFLQKVWWNVRLGIAHARGKNSINVIDEYKNAPNIKVRKPWCGATCEGEKGGAAGKGPSGSGEGGEPAPPPNTFVLANLNETTASTATFTIPPTTISTSGTLTVSYSTSLPVTGTVNDAVPNGITVTQVLTPAPAPIFATIGQVLVNSPPPQNFTVVPGQQFTVNITTGTAPPGTLPIATMDRFFVVIRVSFP